MRLKDGTIMSLYRELPGAPWIMAKHKERLAVLQFKMRSLAGEEIDLVQYQGTVLLIVNVASECGYTPQYKGLQALYARYAQDGFAVLGFPCNQFGQQEPGTADQIAAFCSRRYSVTFPMFEKVDVNGKNQCGLYKHLTSQDTSAPLSGPIQWNFEKFLVARDGQVVTRFRSSVAPESKALVEAIERELAKP
jgi:glutathione peroxidase